MNPKVFGIGFHKTGTTSLASALTVLGYRVTGPNGVRDPDIAQKVHSLARDLVPQYDAFQDNPWPLLFRELDQWYPGSLFILTLRPTDEWLKSVLSHFDEKDTPMRRWIYGVGQARGNEAVFRERYDRHYADVRQHFRDRPAQLLEIDITHGDGWEKLCPFLGRPVPATPFPHANPAGNRRKAYAGGDKPMTARRAWNGLRRRIAKLLGP